MPTLKLEKSVNVKSDQAFRAFTNSTIMRAWLCDVCTADPRVGGRLYLYWNSGYYSAGEFTALEENKSIAFTWFGRGEPKATLVSIRFAKQKGGTVVKLAHKVPGGIKWQEIAEGFKSEWASLLENLAYLLETGKDLRIANRPMLGIIPSDFTAEHARTLGVPVTEGMRLDGVVDGMGAQRAGLQGNDVLVAMAGHALRSDNGVSLANAIAGKKGGDAIEVIFYRGAEKKTVQMELTRRPMADVPSDAQKLAEIARANYDAALKELDAAFEGAPEKVMNVKPAPGEWSALEALAHLVHSERTTLEYMTESVFGDVRQGDGTGANINAYIAATVKIYPTAQAMLTVLHHTIDEVVAFLALLPKDFVANKALYYNLGAGFMQGQFHITGHVGQIKAAIAAAK